MKRAVTISPDHLQRVSDPSSRFYPDYLQYKTRQISAVQLAARLPHVALIGDSLSKDVYISSTLSTFWRARKRHGRGWFFDHSRASGCSVLERLEALSPFVAVEYGGVGALVDNERERQNLRRRILRTRNFSGQVSQLLSHKRFPDLILIWIGHNNVDWAWRCPPAELRKPEVRLQRQSARFRQNYERQVQRLIDRARTERHPVAIVIYGLVNFEAFFQARAIAEALREKNPALYPHLETGYKYFVSLRPAHRRNVVRLVRMVNEELRTMVGQMDRELQHVPHVRVRYSGALANADLSRVEVIHAVDGWHPSAEGHRIFAEAAFRGLAPSLEFLGIDRATAAA